MGRALQEPNAEDRRLDVVRRLLDSGMPLRALEALLPGWEDAVAIVLETERAEPVAG